MSKKPLIAVLAIVVLVVVGVFGANLYVQNRAKGEVKNRLAEWESQLPPGSELSYGEIEVGFFASSIEIEDVKINAEGEGPVTIEEIEVAEFDKSHEPPHYMHLKFKGLERQLADLPPEQAQAMQQMGYERLRGNVEVAYRYDADDKVLAVTEADATFEDMGSISAKLRLTEVDLDQLAQDPQQMPQFKVADLGVRYKDLSLIDRAIKIAAQEGGVDEQAVREQMVQQIEMQSGAMEGAFYQELGEALKQMVRDPGTLVIEAKPAQPVPAFEAVATAMMQPMRLPELLNLTVRTE